MRILHVRNVIHLPLCVIVTPAGSGYVFAKSIIQKLAAAASCMSSNELPTNWPK